MNDVKWWAHLTSCGPVSCYFDSNPIKFQFRAGRRLLIDWHDLHFTNWVDWLSSHLWIQLKITENFPHRFRSKFHHHHLHQSKTVQSNVWDHNFCNYTKAMSFFQQSSFVIFSINATVSLLNSIQDDWNFPRWF